MQMWKRMSIYFLISPPLVKPFPEMDLSEHQMAEDAPSEWIYL